MGSQTLNSSNGFDSTISVGNLAAGAYCVGIDANSANDPNFALSFNTPVSSSPEPSTFVLVSGGVVVAVCRNVGALGEESDSPRFYIDRRLNELAEKQRCQEHDVREHAPGIAEKRRPHRVKGALLPLRRQSPARAFPYRGLSSW